LNIAWRKGLRRLLGLPYRTHSIMLSPLCGTLPLEYELVCRSANFMNNCMNSCNAEVNFVVRNDIFFQRMASPMGRDAQWCCDTIGLLLYNMCSINKDLVLHCAVSSLPDWVVTSVGVVHEVLQVRWNCTCLQLLSSHELDFIIVAVCTG